MQIPSGARKILETLAEHGHEAYIVGGCVRDMLLGRVPGDWDITTSALPDEVKRAFRRTVDTGIEHGTVTVLIGGDSFEVTTYRLDGDYEDHRHPKAVEFTPSLEEDLKRRDFTINAMAYSEKDGLIDMFGGRQDLDDGVIRCVGDPKERFDEDALRMLRGIRFAGQLLFSIEKNTLGAIRELAPTLRYVSAERIRTELTKLLISEGSDRLKLAYEEGLSAHFFPEFDRIMETEQNNPHHCYSVGEHTLRVIGYLHEIRKQTISRGDYDLEEKQWIALVYAGLLHDIAKPMCRTEDEAGIHHFHGHDVQGETMSAQILRRLKFDNDTIHLVKCLVRYHDERYEACVSGTGNDVNARGMRRIRRLMNRVGRDRMPLLFMLQRADIMAQSEYHQEEKLQVLAAGEVCYARVQEANEAVTLSELAISGSDLIQEKGYRTGPEIGRELHRLLEIVLDDPSRNTREELLAMVTPYYDSESLSS